MKIKILLLIFSFLLVYSAIAQEIKPLNNPAEFDKLKEEKLGKVFLINIWSTWCGPCKIEFPELVKLHNDYRDAGFEVVFISLDVQSEIDTKVKEFLLNNNVDFVTYWNNFPREDDFLNYIGNEWDGAIPATFIYDKNGNLVSNFIGKKTYEYFKRQIEPLL
jgi:thiol-disulfide isomerase/thioredoxin